jgi:hypothetical protein
LFDTIEAQLIFDGTILANRKRRGVPKVQSVAEAEIKLPERDRDRPLMGKIGARATTAYKN